MNDTILTPHGDRRLSDAARRWYDMNALDASDPVWRVDLFKDSTSDWQGCAVFLELADKYAFTHTESGVADNWIALGGRVVPYMLPA